MGKKEGGRDGWMDGEKNRERERRTFDFYVAFISKKGNPRKAKSGQNIPN